MIATLVNSLAVIIGASIGLLFRKVIKKEYFDSVLKSVGILVLIFGIIGVLKSMLYIGQDGLINSQYELMLLITIALGTFLGEMLKIDKHITTFGNYLEKKINRGAFSEGFISSSLIFCIGAMAIFGSIEAATGNPEVIYLKSLIDGITAIVLASTLGYGVIFSSISILIYQGSITLLGITLGDFMSLEFKTVFSMVGYVLVACIGLNFLRNEKIKIANMLPSLILVIIYYIFLNLLG